MSFSLVKPSLDTPFHIDFQWWKENDNNWRVFLHSCLCEEHQTIINGINMDIQLDFIDPKTGEVTRIDALQHTLMTHCAIQEGFISSNTTLVDSVFRTFLTNSNQPLSPNELGEMINRPSLTILRTLTGQKVYSGIRPCH
jgi:hypothetical protein